MGLDTTHDCWHGAYSAFNRWRTEIAKAAGMPPLNLMEGFYKDMSLRPYAGKPSYDVEIAEPSLPISWESLKPDPLHELINHSDCDGEIPWESCAAIADRLEQLLPNLPVEDGWGHIGNWRDKTQQFIDGLRLAAESKENVEFH